ncbi:MAG: hypothetical protein AVDCRST_MAG68-2464, partial [uncultured Gemmatimonadetes bacterium]
WSGCSGGPRRGSGCGRRGGCWRRRRRPSPRCPWTRPPPRRTRGNGWAACWARPGSAPWASWPPASPRASTRWRRSTPGGRTTPARTRAPGCARPA